jgi:hypothetical protein
MISKSVMTRSTTPQQVELADSAKQRRREVSRTAKQMVKSGVIPPQRQMTVSTDGFYLPAFPTEESAWIVRKEAFRERTANVLTNTAAVGITVMLPVGGFTYALTGGDSTGLFIMAGASLVTLVSPWMIFRKVKKSYNQISDAAYAPFAAWVKSRYGLTVSRARMYEDAKSLIATGHASTPGPLLAFEDKVTHIKYAVRVRPNSNELYLSYAESSSTLEIPLAKNSASVPPMMVEALNVPVDLHEEAAELHKQLLASVALLKTQELTIEAAHQVERTVNVVNTVITKYLAMAKLKTSEKTERELVEFLRNQVAFIDELIEQHADELGKEISVEIAAVTAAEKNNLLLEVQR